MMMNNMANRLLLELEAYETSHSALVKNTRNEDLSVLNVFQPHSLFDQNTAALMDRIDSKFLLPMNLFTPLMQSIAKDYTILNAHGRRLFNYQTTYFDNEKRQFYLDHHNGKLNRYKVRFRRYVESDMGYMEIKFKNNQKRTIKRRIPMNCISPDQVGAQDFVERTLGYSVKLEPVLLVNYQRITLLNKHDVERITLDLNLSFHNPINGEQSIQNKTFIVEIKQERKPIQSSCRKLIKSLQHREIDFSKYCIGSALTEIENSKKQKLKTNRFKTSLCKLKQLNPEH